MKAKAKAKKRTVRREATADRGARPLPSVTAQKVERPPSPAPQVSPGLAAPVTKATRKARQRAVLAAFRTTASVSRACKAAGTSRRQHYVWLETDAEYLAAFERAKDEAAQQLEDEAVRRAYKGFDEPVVFQGEFTYPYLVDKKTGDWKRDEEGARIQSAKPLCIRKHSDALLQFLLKAWRPTKYRENWKGEISGPGGGPIGLTEERLGKLTDDQLANLIELTRVLTGDRGAESGATPPAAE